MREDPPEVKSEVQGKCYDLNVTKDDYPVIIVGGWSSVGVTAGGVVWVRRGTCGAGEDGFCYVFLCLYRLFLSLLSTKASHAVLRSSLRSASVLSLWYMSSCVAAAFTNVLSTWSKFVFFGRHPPLGDRIVFFQIASRAFSMPLCRRTVSTFHLPSSS